MYKTTSSIPPYVNFEKETLHLFSEFIAVANCLIFNELDVRDSGTRMFLFLNLQLDLFFFTPNQPPAEFFSFIVCFQSVGFDYFWCGER